MKYPLPLTFLFACLVQAGAYAQDTTYLDAAWKPSTPDKATYFRVQSKNSSGWLVENHYRSGKIQMTGLFEDDSLSMMNGEFKWYNQKGHLYHQCNYAHGQANGSESFYYDNGRKKMDGSYTDGKRTGEWVGYYPSGQISAKAQFDGDKQVSAKFYNEDGTVNRKMSEFIQEASFPGGTAQMRRFLSKELTYPEKALKNKIQGRVMLSFKVNEQGRIEDIRVMESVDKALDNEAVRVVRLMPDWQPALIGGIPSDGYCRLPVEFRL